MKDLSRGIWMASVLAVAISNAGFAMGVEFGDSTVSTLPEMTVTADKEMRVGDMVKLYLGKENCSFTTSALDAISSLSRFAFKINSESLTTVAGKNVTILINGVPSSGTILSSYRPEDIARIEYYDVPPAKYQIYGEGPLANVILKKRHDYIIGGNVFTNNALTTAINSGRAAVHYTDSLNMARIHYSISNRHVRCWNDERYEYSPNDITMKTGDNFKERSLRQNITGIYQRYQGKNLFNATLTYSWLNQKNSNPTRTAIVTDRTSGSLTGEGFSDIRDYADTWSADLYYRRDFSNDESLSVNVVGSYSNSGSDEHLGNRIGHPWEDLDFDRFNNLRNETAGITAYAGYARPMLGGAFSASVKYAYSRIHQHNLATSSWILTENNNSDALVSIRWLLGNFMLIPDLGVNWNIFSSTAGRTASVAPIFSIRAMTEGTGKFRNFRFLISSSIFQVPPSLGETTGSMTYIDRYYVSKGNPDIRPYYNWGTQATVEYSTPDGRFYINGTGNLFYEHDSYRPFLSREGELIVRQLEKISDMWVAKGELSASARPLSWIQVQFFARYNSYHYTSPHLVKMNRDSWTFVGSIAAFKGPWVASFTAYSPEKMFKGDIITSVGHIFDLAVQYRWRGLTVGAQWRYSSPLKSWGDYDGFSFLTSGNQAQRNCVTLSLSYAFQKGKARTHKTKDVNNLNIDEGLRERER